MVSSSESAAFLPQNADQRRHSMARGLAAMDALGSSKRKARPGAWMRAQRDRFPFSRKRSQVAVRQWCAEEHRLTSWRKGRRGSSAAGDGPHAIARARGFSGPQGEAMEREKSGAPSCFSVVGGARGAQRDEGVMCD